MNNLISQVTPQTRGILWFPSVNPAPRTTVFQAIDYLLDGLMTSSLATVEQSSSSRVIVGKNFNSPLYVFICTGLLEAEFDSFIRLVKPQLLVENDLLVIDENEIFQKVRSRIPKDMISHFRMAK